MHFPSLSPSGRLVTRALALGIVLSLLLGLFTPSPPDATAQSSGEGQPAAEETEILWDEWGTPHVFATNTEGAFRAFGWAQMHSHGNLLLRLLAQSRGIAAQYGGPDFLVSDRAVRIMALREQGEAWYAAQTPAFRRNIDAFAAGINAYAFENRASLDETFLSVLPVDGRDVLAHVARVMFIFLANSSNCGQVLPVGAILEAGSLGSNGWAIGPTHSATDNSLLLANPHLAWGGEQTFYEAQLVAPGYDFYGGTIVGFPVLTMGFNDNLGWAHTVSTLDACDVYALTPADDGYLLDGATVPFETRTETLRVRQEDGTLAEEALTLRRSVHGPVVEQDGALLALRIAAVGQTSAAGLIEQWWDMGRAQNLQEFRAAVGRNQLPIFSVIYADRDGHIYAAFAGQVPRRPSDVAVSWAEVIAGDTTATLWTDVHPFAELPQVVDPPGAYVQNSNSPPWSFTFPRVPELDPAAYPPYMAPLTLGWRERRGIRMIEETPAMSLDDLVRLKYSTRMELADRLLPELIAAARQSDNELARQAAEVLADWDRAAEPESRGALLFFSWVFALGPLQEATIAGLFAVPEDLADPLNTPRGLANPAAAVEALAAAAGQVQALFGRLDVPWGEVARMERGAFNLPANGFLGDPFGVFRVLVADPALLLAGQPAPVVAGDSFIAAVEFATPVRARVLMTYGNASQPDSPHRGDQLVLAARDELRPAWRTRAEIEAHLEARTVVAAPPSLPDTPVGQQMAWVLGALNAGGAGLSEADLREHLAPALLAEAPPAQLIAQIQQQAASGPYTFQGFTRPPVAAQAVALLAGAGAAPFAMPLSVEPAPPHRITGLNIMPVPAAEPERPRVEGLVDIGGRRLYLSCRGTGSPTVVLEAGLGDTAATWYAVENAVARFTRVCTYDRANAFAGASDPAPTPRAGQNVVNDLHLLLQAAGESGPFVLVGHSIGGHFVRLYAHAHPAEVAGYVLVDASHEDQNARFEALLGPELWQQVRPLFENAANPEGLDLSATAAQVRAARAAGTLPSVPLVVLTRGQPADPAGFPPGWPVEAEAGLWRELQSDLAGLVPGGRQVIAEASGHYIHQGQPELVVDAIREVVQSARQQPPPGAQ